MAQEAPMPPARRTRERRRIDRRKGLRRSEDREREQAQRDKIRKLESLLDLGQIIGLDLQIQEILLQIALKAAEVLEADRCSLFLHDPATDELWTTVALGMDGGVIRMPAAIGLAGHCFQTGEVVNLTDAYRDPRFNRQVDAGTGYRTRSVLCGAVHNRAGDRLGVLQLINKKDGAFTAEDQTFLRTFGNHASVFIEMAQLHKARIDALEQTRDELRRLNQVKDKALDHLSHELRTPLAVIQGTLSSLRRRLESEIQDAEWDRAFSRLDANLARLVDIHREAEEIVRLQREADGADGPSSPVTSVASAAQAVLEQVRAQAGARELRFVVNGDPHTLVRVPRQILSEMLGALLKNAVENTPDEGLIRILWEPQGPRVLLKVQDYGVGITLQNQKHVFEGLFHTLDTDFYASRKPFDFNAGGKGLDLLRIKTYAERRGYGLFLESQRCRHLPTDRDLCPGRISRCPHCAQQPGHCLTSGGSAFCLMLPAAKEKQMKPSPLEGKKVLVVDDEPDVLTIVQEELQDTCKACRLDQASTYEEGLKKLATEPYDLVILDIMGVRGFDLLAAATQKKIPAVMLTAHALSPESLKRSIQMGAKGYVPKDALGGIVPFLEDALTQGDLPAWRRALERLKDSFNLRFGVDWQKSEAEFWKELQERIGSEKWIINR
jgi:signal transduction histidine kinase/CheY-like chemotaxis protein